MLLSTDPSVDRTATLPVGVIESDDVDVIKNILSLNIVALLWAIGVVTVLVGLNEGVICTKGVADETVTVPEGLYEKDGVLL